MAFYPPFAVWSVPLDGVCNGGPDSFCRHVRDHPVQELGLVCPVVAYQVPLVNPLVYYPLDLGEQVDGWRLACFSKVVFNQIRGEVEGDFASSDVFQVVQV